MGVAVTTMGGQVEDEAATEPVVAVATAPTGVVDAPDATAEIGRDVGST